MRAPKRHLKTQHLDAVAFVGGIVIHTDASVLSVRGKGFTATKVGGQTGIYRVTLDSKYRCKGADGHVFVGAKLASAAGTIDRDVKPINGALDQEAGVFDFQVVKSSDGAAVDPTQALELYFEIHLRDTTTPISA